jgi:hypothetical protein
MRFSFGMKMLVGSFIIQKGLESFIMQSKPNKANSRGQISATFVCAMNSTSLTLLQFAGDLRR